jgi:hypothetical protein
MKVPKIIKHMFFFNSSFVLLHYNKSLLFSSLYYFKDLSLISTFDLYNIISFYFILNKV